MNRMAFPYRDFVRVKDIVRTALCEQQEPYVLVTGETGTGKTMLLRELRADLDRARYRVFYFAGAQKLGATGLVRVMARALRISVSTCHYESLDKLTHTLATDETQKILLWFDEAHDLAEETLAQARALCESSLEEQGRVQVLLVGLPRLRAELLACPPLWRRITVREELQGLVLEELPAFLEHHFGAAQVKRLCEIGQGKLFERGKGSPGLLLPMARRVFAAGNQKSRVEPEQVEDILHRFELGEAAMRNFDPTPLRALLHRALARYLTVTPHGFVLEGEPRPVPTVEARILGFGGARTLYRNRKPWCRSLDAVTSVNHADRRCAGCPDFDACTPQVRVDLVIRHHCYRLLLAFSSATNFLEYEARLHREQIDLLAVDHELRVTPRGSWGEVRFTRTG